MRKLSIGLFVMLIGVSAALYFSVQRGNSLEQELEWSENRNDSIRVYAKGTAQKLAYEVQEREIYEATAAQLRDLLTGSEQTITLLQMQLSAILDSLESLPASSVDTVDGLLEIGFPESVEQRDGYRIAFTPRVQMQNLAGFSADSVRVFAQIGVKLDPITMQVVLTESQSGQWETTVYTESPLWAGYGQVQTLIRAHEPELIDQITIHAGLGAVYPGGAFLRIGGGYKAFRASLITGMVSGAEIGLEIPLRTVWPF